MESAVPHVLGASGAARRRPTLPAWLFGALAAVCLPGTALAQRPCSPTYVTDGTVWLALKPPAATRVPDDVCIPPHVGPKGGLPYFDDYAWRAFIALVWPALEGERGVPDPEQPLERVSKAFALPGGPKLVFETYKADWETFPPEGKKPSRWNSYEFVANGAQLNCYAGPPWPELGDFFLAPSANAHGKDPPPPYSYFDNVLQFGFPSKQAGTLVAQNGTLARFVAAYNQVEFNQILAKEWYLAERLPAPTREHSDTANETEERIEFLPGALSVKSSWIDMARINSKGEIGPYTVAHPETFHRKVAWVYDPYYKQRGPDARPCERHVVGLVGLHIVQKTPNRPQWVWATFEHVDNAPDRVAPLPPAPSPGTASPCPTPANLSRRYTFNYDNAVPMLGKPPGYQADQVVNAGCPPMPVNIERLLPINQDRHDLDPKDKIDRNTKETNRIWRHALGGRHSVWQYYELVMTQWPFNIGGPHDPVNCTVNGEMVLCGTPKTTIPGKMPGSRFDHSAFTNTTMETWNQSQVEHGCMNCHSINARDHIDFMWSLRMNAYRKPNIMHSSPALLELQRLLETEVE
jgi:hypothetical protein